MAAPGGRMSAFACALPTGLSRIPGLRSSIAACLRARSLREGPAMALSVNLAQINSAAKGNSDLRETLTGIHLALQSLYAQTGTTPLTKVDTSAAAFTSPPAPSRLAVSGANGSFTVSITTRTECHQRAHLPGDIELARGQLRLRSHGLSRQHQYQLCFAITPAPLSTGGCDRVITSKTGAAIWCSRARSAPA